MSCLAPIPLRGENLGQRHQYLNSLVREATESGATFHDFEALPEHSPVDRLFKIDFAGKIKCVDYTIRNIKDEDMLFVSRALKSTWLLDHRDIINPKYLEDVLFPEMISPAVSKMKHWLYINLREPAMCQEFYQHYKHNTFEFAIKFLSHCTQEFILEETPKILTKLSPHYLKVLSEKCPKVAKMYFDSLATDDDVRSRYLEQEQSYYNSVKCVLKCDADVFLDITEKYFDMNSFSRLSPAATDYIIRCQKTRFTNKLELYVAYLLHIPTLAARLSVDECQEVVIKLAGAKYLQHWFQYKPVEPLIKRLSPDKRAAFKTRVFVNKDVGMCVEKWPYELPESPPRTDSGPHVFDDTEFTVRTCIVPKRLVKKKKSRPYGKEECYTIESECLPTKTELDRLFDEFRFLGFDRTLHDLGQRLGAAGSADRRRDMFLVLVSKSGGRSDAVSALLRLAARHSNEPAHTRASILRSLVKRANVWRLPADVWQYLLEFGHGLGLDGAPAEAACREGLHAVVIRQLLDGKCEPAVSTAFLNDFSTLSEYKLVKDERLRVAVGLQNLLAAAASDKEPAVAAEYLGQLLDVLEIYKVRVEPESPTVEAVKNLALQHADIALPLLERLYNAKIARRELFRVNLKFRCDQMALLNALRHDPSVLALEQVVNVISAGKSRFDDFISKLVVYFDQTEDLTTQLRLALKEKIAQEQKVKLARPLASLLGKDLEMELRAADAAGPEHVRYAAMLRACAHRARPPVNLEEWGWRRDGVKAVATRAMRCREVDRTGITRALALERRTVRVALALSLRSAGELVLETFASAATLRPVAALHVAMLYFRSRAAGADPRVWDIVKPLFFNVDLSARERLLQILSNESWIPSAIKPDYCATLYLANAKISKSRLRFLLRHLCTLLPDVSDESIDKILLILLEDPDEDMPPMAYPVIFIRYLMLSRNNEDLEKRFSRIGDRLLDRLDFLRYKDGKIQIPFATTLDEVMESLKYNAAFFNTKFSSCLSVLERVLAWMQTFMPKEEYFNKYVHMHLTMLYFKAVRQSMKQMPEVFADAKRKKSEGVEAVGFIFGRYIAREVAELVGTYFDSVVELYTDALVEYLGDHFIGVSRGKFIGSVLKGVMTEAVGSERRMVVYVLGHYRHDIEEHLRKEIKGQLLKDQAIEIFVHTVL